MERIHREEATKALNAIPLPVRKRKWRRTLFGGLWLVIGLGLIAVAGFVVVDTREIGAATLSFLALGLACFGMGSHMASGEITAAGAQWVIGAARDVLSLVRRNNRG